MIEKLTLRHDGNILLEVDNSLWFTWVIRSWPRINHDVNGCIAAFTELVAENPGCYVTYRPGKDESSLDLPPFGKSGYNWLDGKYMHAADIIQELLKPTEN